MCPPPVVGLVIHKPKTKATANQIYRRNKPTKTSFVKTESRAPQFSGVLGAQQARTKKCTSNEKEVALLCRWGCFVPVTAAFRLKDKKTTKNAQEEIAILERER